MDEEKMWKGFYQKLQELQTNPPTEHDSRLQDTDGGFFEKFGSLLRQKSEIDDNLKTSLAPFAEDLENENNDAKIETDCVDESNFEQCINVETYTSALPINSNKDKQEEMLQNAVGMNVEDLYEEVLFEICNNIGCESKEVCTETLIEFIQDAFKIPIDKHEGILKLAQNKEPPKIRLNIEVIKAENLMPKDANGLSDPFVTLYLESNSSHRYNTSVKPTTLNPVWEEHFSLPITESPRDEMLVIEVWDFDAAETVKDKVGKLFDVKGVKGLRKLMKEIAVTASTGKHDNELIGRTSVTLKSIPVTGLTVWYNLEKGAKTKSRGSILINLSLSAEKNKRVAAQEHKHLLKLLLLHELESSGVAKFWWKGKFSPQAEAIRSQHAMQSGLNLFECSIIQWSVYSDIHEEHPLCFSLFRNILEVVVPVLKCLQKDSEDVKSFWDGAKRIFPSCYVVVRKLRLRNISDKQAVKMLCEVLDIFAYMKSLDINPEIDLFPKNLYGWLNTENERFLDIDNVMEEAIQSGTKEWLQHIIEGNRPTEAESKQTDDDQLQYLIKIVEMIRSDLQRAMEYFDKHFYQKIRLNYSSVLYRFYDVQVFDIAQSITVEVCRHIKRLDVPDDQFEFLPNIDNVNMGTTLFELYLVLKRFLTLGKALCPNEELKLLNYHTWFTPGVTHWLDISIIKALTRIEKAIELDLLKAVDETVKYSSSAVDTLAIFYQIKIFWQQLDWPDIEGSYAFVAKIVDDICRCCIFYAKRMSRRLENNSNMDNELFSVSTEWCFAINNIDFIRQSLPPFIKELGTDDIITKLGEYCSSLEADRCEMTIKNVIENALDIQRNQILELIEIVVKKMAPPIKRFLAEGAEVLHENSNSMEKLMMYLESSLATLYELLNEVNFGRILDTIWTELSIIMFDLIQSNLEKRRPPSFFRNLSETLRVMVSSFKIGNIVTSDVEVLKEIERLLDLHAFETADLIHQYYLERLGNQRECGKSEFGMLTIKGYFTENSLVLNIINARNLVPMDKNGACDSFVKVYFLPTNKFGNVSPVKTATQNKTRFPLYDEQFIIKLTDEQKSIQNSLILFSVKDKDLFGMTNQYIAECYVTFADIMANENDQIHMELCRPEYTDSDTIRALEYRQGDKQAKDFIKKLKSKSHM